MKISKIVAFIAATTGFLTIGYFGVLYFARNIMFTLAAAVESGGAISYILQKPSEHKQRASQPEVPIAPMKQKRKTKKL